MQDQVEEAGLTQEELLKIFGTLDPILISYRDYCGDLRGDGPIVRG